MAISHILICRTDNIGDVILTLPLTAYLKQQFPGVKISFLCRAYAAAVVRYCSTVDDVIEMESLADPASYFAQSDIDVIIFAQLDKRLAAAAHKARIPVRIGNAYRTWFNWWHCNRPVHFTRGGSDSHEAQLNFKYLRPLGIDYIPELAAIPAMYHFNIPHDPMLDQMLLPYRFNLIFHPKSNGHGREWPGDYFVQLAKSLQTQQGLHIWVTGSAAEGQWLADHAPELLQLPNVSNVCGQFTLAELACFIQAADGLIASGTGPLHMSAAFGQHTIGLFPAARSMHPGRWGPLGARAQSLCQPVDCKGCKTKHALTCDCMRNIAPALVEKIVLDWAGQKFDAEQPADPA